MSTKSDSEKLKMIQDKCQVILGNLLREEDNKYCVDCDAKGPRWASWNLGIFLCIRCAGIHRNLGVHISKVKSVNLDTWTPEQVACLQQMGNSQARAVYEANLPENFRRPQTDSSLEAFIRAKYEQKKYIAKEWVPPPPPPPAFDIEEEKKKERERKKNKTKPLPQHPTAVPRPHSTGPHSPAIQPELSKQTQLPDSTDLLNLGDTKNVGADIFDAFLSADSSAVTDSTTKTSTSETPVYMSSVVTNLEAEFFNQKDVSDTIKANKMSKESILSLYGSSAVQIPATQHIAPVYGVPGGMYLSQQGFTQVGMPGYPSVPAQGINPCSMGINKPFAYNQFATSSSLAFRKDQHQRQIFNEADDTHKSLLMPHGMGQTTKNKTSTFKSSSDFNTTSSAARKEEIDTKIYNAPNSIDEFSASNILSFTTSYGGPRKDQGGNQNNFKSDDDINKSMVMPRGVIQTGTNMPTVYNPFASISASTNRQDSRNQPNMWIGVSPGVRDESLLMPHGMAQVTQQMANLQLSGQPWNIGVPAPPVNASGMVISTNQTTPGVVWPPNSQNQNQNNSNNLWQ